MHRTHPCPLCRHDAQWAGMAVEHDGSPGAARIIETETYFCRACGYLWDVQIADFPAPVLSQATPLYRRADLAPRLTA